MTGRRPMRFDPALIALQIGLAVEAAAKGSEADGPVVVVMDLEAPAAFQIVRDADLKTVVGDFFAASPAAETAIEDVIKAFRSPSVVLPTDLIGPPPSAPPIKKKATPKKIVPTKQPSAKATRRKPPTRRKRKP